MLFGYFRCAFSVMLWNVMSKTSNTSHLPMNPRHSVGASNQNTVILHLFVMTNASRSSSGSHPHYFWTRILCFLQYYTHAVLKKQFHTFLSLSPDNLQANSRSFESLSTTCPGFDVLRGLLIRHTHLPQVFEAIASLLLEKKTSHTTEENVGLLDHFSSRKSSLFSLFVIL